MAKRNLHRSGSVARKIQDYFLEKRYQVILDDECAWCWFPIPNNPEFCVALEWQAGYDPEDKDSIYGCFMEGEYVVNASIKMTDEFITNGEYALYAETYYITDEEAEYGLTGGTSLTLWDGENDFYHISKCLADEFNKYNRMNKKRDL